MYNVLNCRQNSPSASSGKGPETMGNVILGAQRQEGKNAGYVLISQFTIHYFP